MSEVEINENTSEVAEPITVGGGESSVSFDDLEKVQSLPSKETASKPQQTKGKEPKDVEEKSSKEKASKEEVDPKEAKASKDPKDKAEVDKKAQPVKIFKIKQGDEEISLNSDTLIDVKVNGETMQVPIADLLGEFSGKTDWTKKYSEFDKERKSFQTDRSTLNETLQTFHKIAAVDNNPQEALNFLGQISGMDMSKFWKDFNSKIEPMLEERMKMSPEERKQADLESEVNYYKSREDSQRKQSEQRKTEETYRSRIAKVKQDHGLDDESFYRTYQELKSSGTVPLDKLEPEHVAEFAKNKETVSALESLVKEVNPGLEESGPAVKELMEVWKMYPKLTVEDMKDIAMGAYGSDAAKNLTRKLKKSEPKQTSRVVQKSGQEANFFDDL